MFVKTKGNSHSTCVLIIFSDSRSLRKLQNLITEALTSHSHQGLWMLNTVKWQGSNSITRTIRQHLWESLISLSVIIDILFYFVVLIMFFFYLTVKLHCYVTALTRLPSAAAQHLNQSLSKSVFKSIIHHNQPYVFSPDVSSLLMLRL